MSLAHGEEVRTLEEHEQGGRGINWWGMIFFIASEALIFANLIAAYLYLEIRQGQWRLPTGDRLDAIYPAINTVILLSSSLPAYLARTGIQKGNQSRLRWGLLIAIVLGAIFLVGQVVEYTNLFGIHFTPQYQTFGSAFFTLTGFHGLHVTVGLIFMLIVLIRSWRGDFSAKKHFAVEAAEMYWHFVDVVWIIVFSTVYLLPFIRG